MQITIDELREAKRFFSQDNITILENQAKEINVAQPNFTATILAMEMHGLSRDKVEDLLESIFVIYYVQTVLRRKKLNTISIGQIAKNIKWFGSFITFYNKDVGELLRPSKASRKQGNPQSDPGVRPGLRWKVVDGWFRRVLLESVRGSRLSSLGHRAGTLRQAGFLHAIGHAGAGGANIRVAGKGVALYEHGLATA